MRTMQPGGRYRFAATAAVALLLMAGLPSRISAGAAPSTIAVKDLALVTGFQDTQFGHLQRGRALLAADFNLDGRVDFYVGNPGDDSYILLNVDDGGGRFHFELGPVLFRGEERVIDWGAVATDYDNDGDYDIFVTVGGNEDLGPPGDGVGYNRLLKNLWMESGQTALSFQDVTDQAGVAGPVPPGETDPIPVAGAGAVVGDYDRDGWPDIFENVNINDDTLPELAGRNILWHNNHDGTFTDVTDQVGLGVTAEKTRHSTFLDFDNDGDLDLYENNFEGRNHLWRNRLVEDGVATFEDVTAEFSPPGEDLGLPLESFASAATDFNNDGWEDLIVFFRAVTRPHGPYPPGHALFINLAGTGFVNIGLESGVNANFVWRKGVMGCQVGDVNGDGTPDVYVGNGAPMDSNTPLGGQVDRLYLSTQKPGQLPVFEDATPLIDFPAPTDGTVRYPPYPYRTHGTAIVDVDGDGSQEIAIVNGGPAASPAYVREPDRLFKFVQSTTPSWFIVRPVGDGVTVSRDAIGTRFALTVRNPGGETWTIHRTLFGGSCFSAQNGFEVHFGLHDADSISSLEITWPDGTIQAITEGLAVNSRMVIKRADVRGGAFDQAEHASNVVVAQVQQLLRRRAQSAASTFIEYPVMEALRIRCDG